MLRPWIALLLLSATLSAQGRVLMLGVDYETSTYCHIVEVLYWDRQLQKDPAAGFLRLDRNRLGQFWEDRGRVQRGRVGDSDSRCFGVRDYVNTLLREVEQNSNTYDRLKLETEITLKGEENG